MLYKYVVKELTVDGVEKAQSFDSYARARGYVDAHKGDFARLSVVAVIFHGVCVKSVCADERWTHYS